jgi:hypothetical protein
MSLLSAGSISLDSTFKGRKGGLVRERWMWLWGTTGWVLLAIGRTHATHSQSQLSMLLAASTLFFHRKFWKACWASLPQSENDKWHWFLKMTLIMKFCYHVLWKERKLFKTLNKEEEFKFLDTVVALLLVFFTAWLIDRFMDLLSVPLLVSKFWLLLYLILRVRPYQQ